MYIYITFMYSADAFIQSDHIQGTHLHFISSEYD